MVLDGQASESVPVLSGVPQGSVFGPVLFLIYINALPENIRSSVYLFADDCVLYRNINSFIDWHDCQILQHDLNSLAQWETDWQMKFNVAKCHSMRVTRRVRKTLSNHKTQPSGFSGFTRILLGKPGEYQGLKGKGRISSDDLIPKNRLCRNPHLMTFQIPSAGTNAILIAFSLRLSGIHVILSWTQIGRFGL